MPEALFKPRRRYFSIRLDRDDAIDFLKAIDRLDVKGYVRIPERIRCQLIEMLEKELKRSSTR